MIKRVLIVFLLATLFVVSSLFSIPSYASDQENYDIIYFGSYYCSSCQALENEGVFEQLIEQGYRLKKYMLEDNRSVTSQLHFDYLYTYNVPETGVDKIPIIFVGDTYFAGRSSISNNVANNTIQATADQMSLLELIPAPEPPLTYSFRDILVNLGVTIFMGLGDAFNVCAIAMLLMFVSFLSSTKNKKAIAYICFSYISAIFIMYFIIGAVLAQLFAFIAPFFFIFAWIIVGLAAVLMLLNLYDYIMARREKYQDIKNKLPSGAFKLTKKMMSGFSKKIENGSKSIYVIAFLIGIVVALIEFPCTGQVYISWLAYMTQNMGQNFVFYIYLTVYNLLFIAPLVVISFIAIRTQSIQSVSNFMRERMDIIKLLNVAIFLFVIIYYLIILL